MNAKANLATLGIVTPEEIQEYQQGYPQKQIQSPQQQQQQQMPNQRLMDLQPSNQPHIVLSGPVAQLLLQHNAIPQALVMKGDGTIQNVKVYVDQQIPNQSGLVLVSAPNSLPGQQNTLVQPQPQAQNGQVLQAVSTPQGIQYVPSNQQSSQQYSQQPPPTNRVPAQQQPPSSVPQTIVQQPLQAAQPQNNYQQQETQNAGGSSTQIQQQLQSIIGLLGQKEGESGVNLQNLDLTGILQQLQSQQGLQGQQQIALQPNQ